MKIRMYVASLKYVYSRPLINYTVGLVMISNNDIELNFSITNFIHFLSIPKNSQMCRAGSHGNNNFDT